MYSKINSIFLVILFICYHISIINIYNIYKSVKYALVSKKAQKTLLQDSFADFDFGHF